MDPIHIYAFAHRKVEQELQRERLERHFAARAEARVRRQQRIDTLRRRLPGRRAPVRTVRPAV